MKKTSIVFLVISVLLIITGFVIRNKGSKLAEEKNIDLFRQELTENGDFVETIEFSVENTNKINVNLKDTEINVIGNAEKNYIELFNFNTLEYSAYLNNRSFNIENDLLSSISGRAESGNISFNGVRDFVRFDKHNKDKKINIYLAENSNVKIFDITIEKGNISFSQMSQICDYTVKLNDGDVSITNTPIVSLADLNIKKGNVKLDNSYLANAKIKIENGNIDFSTPSNYIYDYEIESETGEININGEVHKGVFTLENEEMNGIFIAHVGVGNVNITAIAPPATEEITNQTPNA